MGISKIFYALILATALASCGLNNMASKYETVSYDVTPSTLQTHAGKVSLTLDATFPENYFAKKATVKLFSLAIDLPSTSKCLALFMFSKEMSFVLAK